MDFSTLQHNNEPSKLELIEINNQLKYQIKNLNQLLSRKDLDILDYENQNIELLNKLDNEIKLYNIKINDLNKKVNILSDENFALKQKIDSISNDGGGSIQNNTTSINKIKRLENELFLSKKNSNEQIIKISEMETELIKQNNVIHSLNTKLSNLANKNKELQDEILVYVETIEYDAIQLKEMKDQLQLKSDNNDEINQLVTEYEKSKQSTNGRINRSSKNKETTNANNEIKKLTETIKKKDNTITKLKTKLSDSINSSSRIRTLNNKKIVEIKKLKDDKRQLKNTIKDIESLYYKKELNKNNQSPLKSKKKNNSKIDWSDLTDSLLKKHCT